MEHAINLTEEQLAVINAAIKGHSIFFTGNAGTGKSFLVKKLIEKLPSIGLFATSSTGISSVQLGGLTIHAFSGIGYTSAPDQVLLARALNNCNAVERIVQCRVLIIDEISMISLRLFDLLSKLFYTVCGNSLPFGGIQLICVGDFFQLAPTKGPYDEGRYCFLSELWTVTFPLSHCFVLTKIFRQSDPEFISLLEEVKRNEVSETTKQKLEKLCRPIVVPEGNHGLRLNPRVMESFIYNREKLHEDIDLSDLVIVDSIDSGDLSSCQLNQLLLAPGKLVFKLGCPVMCLRNIDNQIKNGSRGTVTSFINNFPIVNFQKENRVMHFSASSKMLWTVKKAGKIGKRLQLPLVPAYSVTIHKSQGMAIEYGELNVDCFWEPGQGYTGFSRFKSMDGLRLLNWKGGPVNIVSKEVLHYDDILRSRIKVCIKSPVCTSTPQDLFCCTCEQNDQHSQRKKSESPGMSVSQSEIHSSEATVPQINSYARAVDSEDEDASFDEIVSDSRYFHFFKLPHSGDFAFPVTVSVVECLNNLSTSYLPPGLSDNVMKLNSFLQAVYDSDNLFAMFDTFFRFIWRTVSDIIFASLSREESAGENYFLSKDQAEDMFFTIEGLAVKKDVKYKWIFLVGQVSSVQLEFYLLHVLLYSMIKFVYKSIIVPLSVSRSKKLIEKIQKGESFKIDTSLDEGRAVIRHLGGWAVHTVLAQLNRYIMLFSSSRNQATQDKVSNCIFLRNLLYDNLITSSSEIHITSCFPSTLHHTDYYNRGNLTYITDSCYLFFLDLERCCEKFLQKSFLLQSGDKFVSRAVYELCNDDSVKSCFASLFKSVNQRHVTNPGTTTDKVAESSETLANIWKIFT